MNAAKPEVSVIVVAPELNDYGRRCLGALLDLDEEIEVLFVPDENPGELDPRIQVLPSGGEVTTGIPSAIASSIA